jgi:hypothetical protein
VVALITDTFLFFTIGNGRGPVSGRSRQCYEMAKVILTKGYVPVIGTGQARMNNSTSQILSNLA